VLDAATGNGAIALLAAKTSVAERNDLRISAVDYANINPIEKANKKELKQLCSHIKFFPNTPIENLPFPDSTFDLITSQYGFEYAEKSAASKEIARTLKTGGSWVAICHFENSKIHKYCIEDSSAYKKAILVLKLDQTIHALLKQLGDIDSFNQAQIKLKSEPVQTLLNALRFGLSDLEKSYPQAAATQYLNRSMRQFFECYLLTSKTQKIESAKNLSRELYAAMGRVDHQISATLSDLHIKNYEEVFLSVGLQKIISEAFLDDNGETLGWLFEFSKPRK
jgi:ubiquinone/menaquinone biosynthesis C-methylase UbiE